MIDLKRSTYVSNVRGLGKELDAKLERIVARAARDGARKVTELSDPPIRAHATSGDEQNDVVSARVFAPSSQWWAGIFDKGSLGKRKVPLKQPGRQERSWKVRRRGKTYAAYRSAKALKTGGIAPQYFFIRAKRHAEQRLAQYLRNGL